MLSYIHENNMPRARLFAYTYFLVSYWLISKIFRGSDLIPKKSENFELGTKKRNQSKKNYRNVVFWCLEVKYCSIN